nr:hypothetical protein CDS [Bradyrhizobium sp.]
MAQPIFKFGLWQFRALQENVNRRRLAIGAPLSRRRLNVRYVF